VDGAGASGFITVDEPGGGLVRPRVADPAVGVGLSLWREERADVALGPVVEDVSNTCFMCNQLLVRDRCSPRLPVAKVPVIGVETLLAESGGMGEGLAEGLSFFIWAFICEK